MGKITLAIAEQCCTPARQSGRDTTITPKRRKKKPTMPHLDGRTRQARRIKAITESFVSALGGVIDDASMVRVRRAAELIAVAEIARAHTLTGKKVDMSKLIRAENLAARAMRELGFDKPRRAVPDLRSYLASKQPAGIGSTPAQQHRASAALVPK
jgi:hypothetical protein